MTMESASGSLQVNPIFFASAAVALTQPNRWSRSDLHLSERGEEPGSALQICST